MRCRHVLAGLACALLPAAAPSQPQPLGPLWQGPGGAITVTGCPASIDGDASCRAVAVRGASGEKRLGGGYIRVTLLWSRRDRGDGPSALVLGDWGGSGGNADLFAVSLGPRVAVRQLGGERFDTVKVRPGPGPLRLTLPFDVEFFNGAPHAGGIVVPLPVMWAGGDFALDLAELTRRTYSEAELSFRELALSEELNAWASDRYPSPRLYPPEARDGTPVAATATIEMMLTGHADQARELLRRAWPRGRGDTSQPMGGETDFWAALCREVLREPLWKRFGLDRLPNAELIRQGARS